jgi:hypothetical protein
VSRRYFAATLVAFTQLMSYCDTAAVLFEFAADELPICPAYTSLARPLGLWVEFDSPDLPGVINAFTVSPQWLLDSTVCPLEPAPGCPVFGSTIALALPAPPSARTASAAAAISPTLRNDFIS